MAKTDRMEDTCLRSPGRRLRIAQVATLYERIPPALYGGTERVVSYLTEELVRRSHEVTLFASGDSQTAAKLVPGCPQALRLIGKPELGAFLQLPMLSEVYEGAAARFDVIHTHVDYWSFPFARLSQVATVATCMAGWIWQSCIRSMPITAQCRWCLSAMPNESPCH